jgi:hypothetical protein
MLDLIRFAIALLPFAAYANVLGLLRLRKVPTVLSGAMDLVLLGMSVIGFVAIGPMELFFPRAAYSLLGVWVWLVLIALYFFVLMLIALNSTPKLVVYGIESEALRAQLTELLEKNSLHSEWLGEMVVLPELGVRACIENAGRHAVSQLVAAGAHQNLTGWFTLERLLVQQLSNVRINQRKHGIVWIVVSLILFGISVGLISNDLPRLQQVMSTMFERE